MNDFVRLSVLTVVAAGFLTVSQILPRVGLYTIAKRRHICCPWVAWLPIGKGYILGCISDQYQYMRFGRRRSRRRLLLVIDCVYPIIAVSFVLCLMVLLGFALIGVLTIGLVFFSDSVREGAGMALILMAILSLCGIPICVFRFQALYDLYQSCNPGAAKVFLIMSIIFSVAEPFFVFSCRNMDEGMPSALRISLEASNLPTEP